MYKTVASKNHRYLQNELYKHQLTLQEKIG